MAFSAAGYGSEKPQVHSLSRRVLRLFEAFVIDADTPFETAADDFRFFDSGGDTAYRLAFCFTLSIVCHVLPRRQRFESSTRRFQEV